MTTRELAEKIAREVYGPYMATVNEEHREMAVDGIKKIIDENPIVQNEAVETLKSIAALGGNLPDARYESRTGPNDAALRGMLYVGCRTQAINTLNKLGVELPAIVKMIPKD